MSYVGYAAVAAANSMGTVKKVDKVLQQWADKNNLQVVSDTVIAQTNGVNIGFCLHQGENRNGYVAAVPVEPASWDKSIQKALAKELKGVGTLFYNKNAGIAYVTITGMGRNAEKFGKKFDTAAYVLSNSLPNLGAVISQTCRYCKQGAGEEMVVEGGVCYSVHGACRQAQVNQLLNEVVENETKGGYILATLCAIIGGIVGTIPSLVLVFTTEYIFSLLFALIPLAAAFGYKVGKGKRNGMMMVIVTLVSIVCSAFMVLTEIYVEVAFEFGEFMDPALFFELLAYVWDAEMTAALLPYALFTIFGIAIAWSSMNKTNKKTLAAAQALQAQAAALQAQQQPQYAQAQAAANPQQAAPEQQPVLAAEPAPAMGDAEPQPAFLQDEQGPTLMEQQEQSSTAE